MLQLAPNIQGHLELNSIDNLTFLTRSWGQSSPAFFSDWKNREVSLACGDFHLGRTR